MTPFDPAALQALIDDIEYRGAPPEMVGQLRGLVEREATRLAVEEYNRKIREMPQRERNRLIYGQWPFVPRDETPEERHERRIMEGRMGI